MSLQQCGFFRAFLSRTSVSSDEGDQQQSSMEESAESTVAPVVNIVVTDTTIDDSRAVSNGTLATAASSQISDDMVADDSEQSPSSSSSLNFHPTQSDSNISGTVAIQGNSRDTTPATLVDRHHLYEQLTLDLGATHSTAANETIANFQHDQMEAISSSTFVSPAGIEFTRLAKPVISRKDKDKHTSPTLATLVQATRESERFFNMAQYSQNGEESLLRQRQAQAYTEREYEKLCRINESLCRELEQLERSRYKKENQSLVDKFISLRAENQSLEIECKLLSLEYDNALKYSHLAHTQNQQPLDLNHTRCRSSDSLSTYDHGPSMTNSNLELSSCGFSTDNQDPVDETQWSCPCCTFKNYYAIDTCEMCNYRNS